MTILIKNLFTLPAFIKLFTLIPLSNILFNKIYKGLATLLKIYLLTMNFLKLLQFGTYIVVFLNDQLFWFQNFKQVTTLYFFQPLEYYTELSKICTMAALYILRVILFQLIGFTKAFLKKFLKKKLKLQIKGNKNWKKEGPFKSIAWPTNYSINGWGGKGSRIRFDFGSLACQLERKKTSV